MLSQTLFHVQEEYFGIYHPRLKLFRPTNSHFFQNVLFYHSLDHFCPNTMLSISPCPFWYLGKLGDQRLMDLSQDIDLRGVFACWSPLSLCSLQKFYRVNFLPLLKAQNLGTLKIIKAKLKKLFTRDMMHLLILIVLDKLIKFALRSHHRSFYSHFVFYSFHILKLFYFF